MLWLQAPQRRERQDDQPVRPEDHAVEPRKRKEQDAVRNNFRRLQPEVGKNFVIL